jgi:ATP synthase protein I
MRKRNMSEIKHASAVGRYKAIGWRMIILQSLGVVIAGALALLWSLAHASSLVLGGIAAILPNALFVLWLFAQIKPSESQQMMKAFYIGEIIKLVAMAAILVAAFRWLGSQPQAVLLGFVIALFLYWLTPFVANK